MVSKKSQKKAKLVAKCIYRVLGYQPLSVKTDMATLEDLSIQNTVCKLSIRSNQMEPNLQLEYGGSILAIEFEGEAEQDLVATARFGLSLLEDFLSAVALVNGATFEATEPVEVARLGKANVHECEFLIFKQLPLRHWAQPITELTVGKVKHLLGHWDGLESGHRLRRAALRYRKAIGNLDDIAAFQDAYIGLESMEPPLAKAVGLQPGTEEVKGTCEACGHELIRKKTSLVGVRTFILDDHDPESAELGRKSDWKLINKLRNDLMHGLVDFESLSDRPHKALLAAMCHLHAAICLASHANDLVSEKYLLARGGRVYLLLGRYKATSLPPLHEWQTSLETKDFKWVPHEEYGFVPQMSIRNSGLKDLEMAIAVLEEPLTFATMDSTKPAIIERD